MYILINVEDDMIISIFSSKFYVKEISRRKDLSSNNSYIYKRGIKLFALQLAVCEVSSFSLSIALSSIDRQNSGRLDPPQSVQT